ncbi:MAG TPA: heparinase II/III family protein [Gemmatimonadales bacterium]|nr:heparinase II/III family protein [Gemmatimonadales bacterium]
MLTIEQIEARRDLIAANPSLAALEARVRGRVERLLREPPAVPAVKAMLSRDGGSCPDDGTTLGFDPWSPDRHACPTCGKTFAGERHHRHWARAQHLWLGERTVDLAVLAALDDDPAAAAMACDLIARYEALYFECRNADNVLGPSHLFFSTYLESMWLLHLLAAAFVLREAGLLPDERVEGINQVADEAAQLIGEFNEGFSNRQTWHAAALTAVAVWFGDEELARTAIESRTGLVGHLADGFGEDGMWFEGENYHLFALRGLMLGVQWARVMGADLLEDPEVRAHFRAALLAPSLTALPDLTFPARKDARFGVSLAQPAYLELWEVGRAWLGNDETLDRWVAALYAAPAPEADHYDAWLHDAGHRAPAARSLADLSAWALLEAAPPVEAPATPFAAQSTLLTEQGLAVLRRGDRYASLECGAVGGGHGHPDRLHLTLHARGMHWLPDPGAGSYVEGRLAWYRSAPAHNAPIVNGESPGLEDVHCEAFDARGDWAWARGRAGEVRRTLVAGPDHLLDLVELNAATEVELLLPWHLQGEWAVVSPGRWEPAELNLSWISKPERFVPEQGSAVRIEARAPDGPLLRLLLTGPAELLRAVGPGLPPRPGEQPFLLQRVRGRAARLVAVLDLADARDEAVSGVRMEEGGFEVTTAAGTLELRFTPTGAAVRWNGAETMLGGIRPAPPARRGLFEDRPGRDAMAEAPHAWEAPASDGTLDGFDTAAPLLLAGEHQYRRSEEPYDEAFTAEAWANWDREALYLAVAVTKPEVVVRPDEPEPLNLDNEPEDIHADGVQVYLRLPDGTIRGHVLTLAPGGRLHIRTVAGLASGGGVTGSWALNDEGYLLTVRMADAAFAGLQAGTKLGFDLLVNEARPDRMRRAGQLVWSGGGGWVYLRGDRQDAGRFGVLELG